MVKKWASSLAFIWIGFVCSISFMEAWLKFKAPLMTVPIGLSVGQLIFTALNRVEWAFALLIALLLFRKRKEVRFCTLSFYGAVVLMLLIQTEFLLPLLKQRVDWVLQEKELPRSFLHFYYIGLEVLKVASLAFFGTSAAPVATSDNTCYVKDQEASPS